MCYKVESGGYVDLDFSVIIPTYNRVEQLLLTLTSFNLQSYPFNRFEVIVVDDCSTDSTKAMIQALKVSYSLIYTSTETQNGRAFARNKGLPLAKGKYIVFCDADFLVVPEFLTVLKDYHFRYKQTIISGATKCWTKIYTHYYPEFTKKQKQGMFNTLSPIGLWRDSFLKDEKDIVQLIDYNKFYDSFGYIEKFVSPLKLSKQTQEQYEKTDVSPWLLFITRCVSVKKKYLDQVGWFDESFIKHGLEDWELGYRLHLNSYKFISVKETLGYHQVHPISKSDPDSDNRMKLFNKYGFSDPELNLLTVHPPWNDVYVYKENLRKLKKYQNQGRFSEAKRLEKKWKKKALEFYNRKK